MKPKSFSFYFLDVDYDPFNCIHRVFGEDHVTLQLFFSRTYIQIDTKRRRRRRGKFETKTINSKGSRFYKDRRKSRGIGGTFTENRDR